MMMNVREKKIGSFAIFQSDLLEVATLLNELQKESKIPLLFASDFENGLAMRIRRGTSFPHLMALGATDDSILAYEYGKIIAEESRAVGVHINFSPVIDLNNNPKNPVISYRSIGENIKLVNKISNALIKGMQDNGIIATAKHFPGHGDTETDSHFDLPVLKFSKSHLDSFELKTFQNAIRIGVKAMMIAHLAIPSIENNTKIPASLSRKIIDSLLLKSFNYKGIVITDGLEMKGVKKNFTDKEIAIMAINSGNDILLGPEDPQLMIDTLVDAVRSGIISEERINRSVLKILRTKEELLLHKNKFIDINEIRNKVNTEEHRNFAKQVARKSITVLQNSSLPFSDLNAKKILCIPIANSDDYRIDVHRSTKRHANERFDEYFNSLLKTRVSDFTSFILDSRSNKKDCDSLLLISKKFDVIICPIFLRPKNNSKYFGIAEKVFKTLEKIAATKKSQVVFVAFGNPYIFSELKTNHNLIITFSDCEASIESAIETIFGEIETKGKLPITISKKFPFKHGLNIKNKKTYGEINKFFEVDSLILRSIKNDAFPSAQISILKDGKTEYIKSYGNLTYETNSQICNLNTLYDIASLTKVIATTTAIMLLYDAKKISLSDKVSKYISEFANNGKENITLENLLLHNSGLERFELFYERTNNSDSILKWIYNSKLVYKTGDSTLYSDLGFIVLGKIVEKISKISLDEFCKKNIFQKLEMKNTMFVPKSYSKKNENIAPTENDKKFRKQIVKGVVHDETSYLLKGVSGHAGVFSNVSDLSNFMKMIMNYGKYNGNIFIKEKTIELFTKRFSHLSSRAFGWDTKTVGGYSASGNLFSKNSFGHTGFTGTSIWCDKDRNLCVIFLTNRTFPSRENRKIVEVRANLHDAVVRSFE